MRLRPSILVLALAVPASLVAGLALGSADVSASDVVSVLADRLAGRPPADPVNDAIVWSLRLPRVVLAFVVGAGLSVVGVAMQALVRNPLADPYVLGLSSGSTAGAALYFLGIVPLGALPAMTLPAAAFAGGLLTLVLVYAAARDGSSVPVTRLLLAGVAMSALMASLTSFLAFVSPDPNKLRAVLFWLLGSLSGASWTVLPGPTLVLAVVFLALMGLARPLDALLLGEDPARSLGIPVERMKHVLIALSALLTGTLVAYSGAIGFVGLIVPHAVRSLTGVSHRRVLPTAFVSGGLFLVWSDLLARGVLPGQDLPVGIVTALAGVPFFLLLLRRNRRPFA